MVYFGGNQWKFSYSQPRKEYFEVSFLQIKLTNIENVLNPLNSTIFSINGFSSMSFQDINDEVIFRVEKFVQLEMLEIYFIYLSVFNVFLNR